MSGSERILVAPPRAGCDAESQALSWVPVVRSCCVSHTPPPCCCHHPPTQPWPCQRPNGWGHLISDSPKVWVNWVSFLYTLPTLDILWQKQREDKDTRLVSFSMCAVTQHSGQLCLFCSAPYEDMTGNHAWSHSDLYSAHFSFDISVSFIVILCSCKMTTSPNSKSYQIVKPESSLWNPQHQIPSRI